MMMKRIAALFLCLLAVASADVPKKAPYTQYARLWTDSPFTTKPVAGPAGPVSNPLDDYALGGVTQVTGGYSVILLDKKKPDERIRVEPGSSPDYKVLEVIRKEGYTFNIAVRMSYQGAEKIVEFDDKLLALKAAPLPKQPPRPNGQPAPAPTPVPQPAPGGGGYNGPGRQPRPRVVVPQPQSR